MGVRSLSGQYVTPQRAMRASAVLACLRILCEDLSALPLNLYRRTPQGAVLAVDDPRYRLLHDSPNPWLTSMELREGMILDTLLFGQSFTEKVIGADGIEALYPLAAGRMFPANFLDLNVPPPTPLFWRYTDPRGQRVLMSDDIWTIRMLAPAGYLEGSSLILLAREAIGLLLAAEEQGARLFSNGVQSNLVLQTDQELDADHRNQLRDALQTTYSGSSNAWRTIILDGGLKAERLGLTAQESQYLESRQYQLEDIARIFRVPEVLLGISSRGRSSTYASAEQFFLAYVKHTLTPWCTRIEQAANRDLLAPSETDLFCKHDLDSITRADLQTRYAAHAAGISSGFLTRNEARQMENLPTLPGLDEPLSPLNMGKGSDLKPAQGAGARLAHQLARNSVAHEMKLLADGKSRADVFTKLLPGYLASKTGMSAAQCAEYCQARLQQDATEVEAVELLAQILIGAGPR